MSEKQPENKKITPKLCIHGSKTCEMCMWLRGYPIELFRDNQNNHQRREL